MTPLTVLAQQDLNRFDSALVRIVDQALASPVFLTAAVGAAFAVGAFHALAPGHGKTIAAAYLVGGRGRVRDALLLGVAVAIMHTASVVVLALGLGAWLRRGGQLPIAAADVTPSMRLASGLMVVALGIYLVVRQWRDGRRPRTHEHADALPLSRRGLVVLGMSGGLLPSPSAFLVLVTASVSGRLLVGLALVVVFSIGLATTLTLIGVAVVRGRSALVDRISGPTSERLARIAARVAAGVILAGGVVMTAAGANAL